MLPGRCAAFHVIVDILFYYKGRHPDYTRAHLTKNLKIEIILTFSHFH